MSWLRRLLGLNRGRSLRSEEASRPNADAENLFDQRSMDAYRAWRTSVPVPPRDPVLERDFTFFQELGPEVGPTTCRKEDCARLTVGFSVMCRQHHFEMVRQKPCPFPADAYRETLSGTDVARLRQERDTRARISDQQSPAPVQRQPAAPAEQQLAQTVADFSRPLPPEHAQFGQDLSVRSARVRDTWDRVVRDLSENSQIRVRVVSLGGYESDPDYFEFSKGFFFLKLTGQLGANVELIDAWGCGDTLDPKGLRFGMVVREIKGVLFADTNDTHPQLEVAAIQIDADRSIRLTSARSTLRNAQRSVVVLCNDALGALRDELGRRNLSREVTFVGYGVGHRDHDIETLRSSFETATDVVVRIASFNSGQRVHQYADILQFLKRAGRIPADVDILLVVGSSAEGWAGDKARVHAAIARGRSLVVLATDYDCELTREVTTRHAACKSLRFEF
jgi:hypothetical protein